MSIKAPKLPFVGPRRDSAGTMGGGESRYSGGDGSVLTSSLSLKVGGWVRRNSASRLERTGSGFTPPLLSGSKLQPRRKNSNSHRPWSFKPSALPITNHALPPNCVSQSSRARPERPRPIVRRNLPRLATEQDANWPVSARPGT